MTLISENGELILKNKKINLIPRTLGHKKYDNILVFDIRGNEITEIEGCICENLPSLKKLDARNNKIKSISVQIRALSNLNILRLDHNELQYLPNEIGELLKLEEFSFSDNKVTAIPTCYGQLVSLRILNMADNDIKFIP